MTARVPDLVSPATRCVEPDEAEFRLIDTLIFALAFYTSNRRMILCYSPNIPCTSTALEEMQLWIAISGLIVWTLSRERLWQAFIGAVIQNWPVLLFIGWAAASLSWTILWPATVFKLMVLVGSSLFGVYAGVRYSPRSFIRTLALFVAITVALCYAAVAAAPEIAITIVPYNGAWRGIFWHRNYLGSFMALASMVLLFALRLGRGRAGNIEHVAVWAFYILALLLVGLSRSVTGIILTVMLHVLAALGTCDVRLRTRLRRIHYYAAAGVVGVLIPICLAYSNALLGLFGRDSSLTGRTGLWSHLFSDYVALRPWHGYGFGAIWDYDDMRIRTARAIGWSYPVYTADNGYVDILLNIGAIGLSLLGVVLIVSAVRSLRYLRESSDLVAWFPLEVLAYVAVTNVTLSFLLELDSFAWIALLAVLTLTRGPTAQLAHASRLSKAPEQLQ